MTNAKPTRPLTDSQTNELRLVLGLVDLNGGTTRLLTAPSALIRRGLVAKVEGTGTAARYTLTAEGREIAVNAQCAHDYALAVRRANRGHNVAL